MKLDEARAAAEIQAHMAALGLGGEGAGQRTVSNLPLEVLAQHALADQQAAGVGAGAGAAPGGGAGLGSPRGAASPRGAPAAPAGVGDPGGRGSTWASLVEICGATAPSPAYLRYHEELLKRCLLRIFTAPPRCALLCAGCPAVWFCLCSSGVCAPIVPGRVGVVQNAVQGWCRGLQGWGLPAAGWQFDATHEAERAAACAQILPSTPPPSCAPAAPGPDPHPSN